MRGITISNLTVVLIAWAAAAVSCRVIAAPSQQTFDIRPGFAVSQSYLVSHEMSPHEPVSSCQARCESDRRCSAFTWRLSASRQTGLCYLYAGGVTPVAAPTVTLGIAPDLTPPAVHEASRIRAQRSPEEVVDLHAPRIRPRNLTTAERSEVQSLLAAAMSSNDLQWSVMEPLMALAESGDRAAMHAVLMAFRGPQRDVVYRGVWHAPWESFAGQPAAALAGRWAGEYWRRHGADQIAASLLTNCFENTVVHCGVVLPEMDSRQRSAFLGYGRGSGRAPRLNLTFEPAYRGEAALRARYDELVARRTAFDPLSAVRAATYNRLRPDEAAWVEAYAAVHPEVAEIQQASIEAEAARVQAERRQLLVNVANGRARAEAVWTRLWGRTDLTDADEGTLEAAATVLGDDYVLRIAPLQTLRFDSNINMVCSLGHASCERNRTAQTARQAALQAEIRQSVDTAAARQAAVAAAIGAGPGLVEVRRYDRGGNFIDTMTMTATQAEIIGARPQ